jgi:hypothetical protein
VEEAVERTWERQGRMHEVAVVAVTLRLVFLITSDHGRAEEEGRLLSDVSIMTRLCTVVYTGRQDSQGARAGWASWC